MALFGEWIDGSIEVACAPFKHAVIHEFLSQDMWEVIQRDTAELSCYGPPWHLYDNPLECRKHTLNDMDATPTSINRVFEALASPKVIQCLSKAFDIAGLENDPHLHGAGIHAMERKGSLAMHLDYEIHPITGKQRRLNIILCLNDKWDADWGGNTELWDAELKQCIVSHTPSPNTAIVFETSDIAWHGVPDPIVCPADTRRLTLAFYYVSDPVDRPNVARYGAGADGWRHKAAFAPRPQDAAIPGFAELCRIRSQRRLTEADLAGVPTASVPD